MTQTECHVVSATEMFVNQRLKIDVRQNIAAVGQERFAAEMTFRVFDTAARFKQVRLVNQRDGKASVLARGKESLEQFRMPVRIDDESVHSHGYQMIECESNEGLLEDRDERLWQLLGQRTQTRAKTR